MDREKAVALYNALSYEGPSPSPFGTTMIAMGVPMYISGSDVSEELSVAKALRKWADAIDGTAEAEKY